jgi:hypothetical protein
MPILAAARSSAFRIAACHLPGQVPEGVGVEQRLVELPPLSGGQLDQRRIADDLFRRVG